VSRFTEPIKPINLAFDLNLYDAVSLSNGLDALITGYGIYDNQYWCEVGYPDGIHLGGADYFSFCNPAFCGTKIVEIMPELKARLMAQYVAALGQYPDLYAEHIADMKKGASK
jgi:hypothetical protein